MKKRKRKMRLRNTILFTTILITTTVVILLGYISNRQFKELLTERMVDDYQENVNALYKNVVALINYSEDFIKYMSLDDSFLESISDYQNMTEETRVLNELEIKRKWDSYTNRLVYSTSTVYSLEIYTEDEMIYSYMRDAMKTSRKNIPQEIIDKAFSQSAPVWSDLLTLKQYRSYVKRPEYGFALVKSIRDKYSKRIGTIAVFVRESSFSNILETANEDSNSKFYLVGKEDTILSAVDKDRLYDDAKKTLNLSEKEYEQCVEKGILLKEDPGKVPVLYISRNVGENGFKLISQAPLEELGKQQREFMGFMISVELLTVGLAIIGAWMISNRVTKPLGKLMNVMEGIKEGNETSHLRFEEEDTGEIGILGNRFNELMDELDLSIQQIYEEQRQRRHNEVRLLQAQIVPHFLYNTMGIITSFIKLGMTEEALTTIQNLVSFYRLSLSSGKEIITLKEEVELARNYMDLQQLRYIEYMEYSIECDPEVENIWLPKLSIQPLMENVLHHGLKPGMGKCQIRVKIMTDKEKKKIRITVWDNGTGIEEARLKQLKESLETGRSITNSFGILNINQRLKLMYGESYHMGIDSMEGEYTQFILELPLNYTYEDERNV